MTVATGTDQKGMSHYEQYNQVVLLNNTLHFINLKAIV